MIIGTSMGLEICQILESGLTQFVLLKKIPDGYTWSGVRLTRTLTSRPDHLIARVLEINGKACQIEGEAKVV